MVKNLYKYLSVSNIDSLKLSSSDDFFHLLMLYQETNNRTKSPFPLTGFNSGDFQGLINMYIFVIQEVKLIINEDMSLKNSYTTSDYMEWDSMLSIVRKLYRDKEYRMSLLIGCGSFFGLRISDILSLTWDRLLDSDTFTVIEHKTGKRRDIRINLNFQKHIADCYKALNITDKSEKCFISRKHTVYTTQRINKKLKEIRAKYGLKIEHFSTHSLRKTFGRKVVEAAGEDAEFALIKLSELFNHSDVKTTRRYLGLRQQELLETYSLLTF